MDTSNLKRTLGENIRRLRKAKGLTQENLAELLNRTSGSISRFESGQQIVGVDLLVQMANFFSVSIDELIRPEGSASHLKSITNMLTRQPDEALASLEPFIQLWISQDGASSPDDTVDFQDSSEK